MQLRNDVKDWWDFDLGYIKINFCYEDEIMFWLKFWIIVGFDNQRSMEKKWWQLWWIGEGRGKRKGQGNDGKGGCLWGERRGRSDFDW